MNEKSFETKFPNLKNKIQFITGYESEVGYLNKKNIKEGWGIRGPTREEIIEQKLTDLFVELEYIEKYCLDKQKVREELNKIKEKLLNRMCSPVNNPDDILNIVGEMKEELGL